MSVSRRQIAHYIAQAMHNGEDISELAKQLASYLYTTKKTNESELLLRDIETVFSEEYGITLAKVTSAYALDDSQRQEIKQFIQKQEGSKDVTLQETTDKELIGGLIVKTPSSQIDTSVRHQLQQLKALSSN